MKLNTWIEKTGPKIVAKRMKVDPSTVSLWRRGKTFPRAKRLMQLHRLSGGKVSFKEMINHFA